MVMTTFTDEGQRLRAEVGRLPRGQGHKYAPELRRKILAWVDHAKSSGMSERRCGELLGIKSHRFAYWRQMERRVAEAPKALVPVAVRDDEPFGSPISFVAPSGYRIVGVTIEQAVALLRAFA
jgi:hypothetical protein